MGEIVVVPDFNKLPHSLCSQGDKNNILMMFKLVLFDDFESMLLQKLNKTAVLYSAFIKKIMTWVQSFDQAVCIYRRF